MLGRARKMKNKEKKEKKME